MADGQLDRPDAANGTATPPYGARTSGARTCSKCHASYGFAACRRPGCPFAFADAQTVTGRPPRHCGRAHVVVLGNEKGGTGKSTIAMHLIVALLKRGHSVASLDLDARQGSLSRYLDNRRGFADRNGLALALPEHRRIHRSAELARDVAEREERDALEEALGELGGSDFLVIDTPGSDSFLSRSGHSLADTLITPINDSLLDLDLLVRVDPDDGRVIAPSLYSEMVWEQRRAHALAGRPGTDWIVLRNRLTHIDARNKRQVGDVLEQAAQRMAFRLAPGFGERVIFRELFLKGLTLLDLRNETVEVDLTLSHVAARQEIRALLDATRLVSRTGKPRADGPDASTPAPPAVASARRPGIIGRLSSLIGHNAD